ncbi:Uncharacterized protein Rs2_14595 [Raphanus sativus]|nr:Uncharacterized protein Rs2_14595 [Raphanus sativus]
MAKVENVKYLTHSSSGINKVDGTYTHSIEKFAHKVCSLAREEGDEHQKRCLMSESFWTAMPFSGGTTTWFFSIFPKKVIEDNRRDSWSMMSLPPTSPFDNFLKAAGEGR